MAIYQRAYNQDNNIEEFFSRFNYQMATTTDIRALFLAAGEELKSLLGCRFVGFMVRSDDSLLQGGSHHSVRLTHALYTVFERELVDSQADIIRAKSRKTSDELRDVMQSVRVDAVLPLRVDDQQLLGCIVISGLKESWLSRNQRSILVSSSYQLSVVFQNALAIRLLALQKGDLERQVEAATTELRTSNSKLRELDETKDEFISMASHQLRTPLTSVKGYLSMVLEGDAGELNSDQKRLLTEAFTSSERMVQLIGDFLNVSRLQTGKFVIEATSVDLNKLVEEEVNALRGVAESKKQHIKLERTSHIPVLQLDDAKIRQVVMNYIDNAMYYSPENTTITVTASVQDDRAIVTVKDQGIGVPADQQAKLFTKFYRADNARTQRPDGTGVGIFLAKKIVDMHGGKIIFESEENQGSTFGFSLPIAALSEQSDQSHQ